MSLETDIAIRVKNLTKIYHLYNSPKDRFKEALHPRRKKYHHDFYALKDVSFEVKKGETVGIIGRNGSGKSTLLKILTGVLTPNGGNSEVKGKVSSLLELGTGFNPELTGIENVYFNGTILGFSKDEMDRKLDDILAFADIGEFVYQPVKMYSSGMFVRLAFAVAISVNPEVLIVDEALSVGDAFFQAKCFKRLEELKDKGTTILLVTHNTNQILSHCKRAILLNDGVKLYEGDANEVVNRYLDLLFGKKKSDNSNLQKEISNKDLNIQASINRLKRYDNSTEDIYHTHLGYNKNEYVWGTGKVKIIDYLITNSKGEYYPGIIESEELMDISFKAIFIENVDNPVYGLLIKTIEGVYLHGTNSIIEKEGDYFIPRQRGDIVSVNFQMRLRFATGNYLLSFGVSEDYGNTPLHRRYDSVLVNVQNKRYITGYFDLESTFCEEFLNG